MNKKLFHKKGKLWVHQGEGYWELTTTDPKNIHWDQVLLIMLLRPLFGIAVSIGSLLIYYNTDAYIESISTVVVFALLGIIIFGQALSEAFEHTDKLHHYVYKRTNNQLIYYNYLFPFKKTIISDISTTKISTNVLVEEDSYFLGEIQIQTKNRLYKLPIQFESKSLIQKVILALKSNQSSFLPKLQETITSSNTTLVTKTSNKGIAPFCTQVLDAYLFSNSSYNVKNGTPLFDSKFWFSSIIGGGFLFFAVPLFYGLIFTNTKFSFFGWIGLFFLAVCLGLLGLLTLYEGLKDYLIKITKCSPKGIQKYIRLFPFIKLQQIPKKQIVMLSTSKKEEFYFLNVVLENGQQQLLDIRFKTEEQALKHQQQIEYILNI